MSCHHALAAALLNLDKVAPPVRPQELDDLVVRAKRHVHVRQVDHKVKVGLRLDHRRECVQQREHHCPRSPLH